MAAIAGADRNMGGEIVTTPGSTYLNRTAPGVYINEADAFGSSIVGVATAIPAFVGYTEFASNPTTGAPAYLKPISIASMAEFQAWFGGPPPLRYTVSATPFGVTRSTARFALYRQMQLFFANGGGSCAVVSCGSYWQGRSPVAAVAEAEWQGGSIAEGDLIAGVAAAAGATATMILAPEACQLVTTDPTTGALSDAGYGAVVSAMIAQAGTLQDRMAILDLPGCLDAATIEVLRAAQRLFTAAVVTGSAASYGAAYAPALVASVATMADVTCRAVADDANTVALLAAEARATYAGDRLAGITAAIATAFPASSGAVSATPPAGSSWQAADALLTATLPTMQRIKQAIAADLNVVAPSGAIAGAWTASDDRDGVWNAPANLALASVTGALYAMNDAEQAGFNQPSDGRAIDVVRAQPNRGTVIWGARTLDGNSIDHRYIQVRRTLIYVEQSIRQALLAYVFAPNDAATWSAVSAAVTSFLTGLWQQGGLMGARPGDAFTVACGLGTTMTPAHVLDGTMVVSVSVRMLHVGDVQDLTFVQRMGS